jgi:hypothetical protein
MFHFIGYFLSGLFGSNLMSARGSVKTSPLSVNPWKIEPETSKPPESVPPVSVMSVSPSMWIITPAAAVSWNMRLDVHPTSSIFPVATLEVTVYVRSLTA